jgi:hypothetical protein
MLQISELKTARESTEVREMKSAYYQCGIWEE